MSFAPFLTGKATSLAMTAVLALTVTILIAGYGGAIDQIMLREIERSAREDVAHNPSFRGLTLEQREKVMRDIIQDRITLVGLDRPFLERMPTYLLRTLSLDFGTAWFITSDTGSRKVVDIIAEKLPRTVLLFTTGTLITLSVGIPIGMRMARHALGFFDRFMTSIALISNALPLWWTGMLFIIIFSFTFKILPSGGFVGVPPPENPVLYGLDVLYHMILPLLTILAVGFGSYAYIVRNMVVRVFQEDFIMAERARGIHEKTIVYRHALRVASPPIATLVGFAILGSLGGAIISEVVFNWPGMGRLYWDAVQHQDLPLIIGLTYISIFLYVTLIFLLEVIYTVLDPRVRVTPQRR